MKINGYICQPRPIYQLVNVAAGWIDFFFFFFGRVGILHASAGRGDEYVAREGKDVILFYLILR